MRRLIVAGLLGLAALLGNGCGPSPGRDPLLVFGAASAADALREAGARYESRDGGEPIALHIGGSGALLRQIELGAPADLFVSASHDEIERLLAAGLARPGDRHAIASNRLVIVVPATATPPTDPAGLADRRFERIAIGNPATAPVGRFAVAALDAIGLHGPLATRLLEAEHARQALAWVERGEVDAAVVYATDARRAGGRVVTGPLLDRATHPPIRYEAIVVSTSGARGARTRRFASWLAGDDARAVFADHGFDAPVAAR